MSKTHLPSEAGRAEVLHFLFWFWREGRHPVDSSEPAVNFLGRRESMVKTTSAASIVSLRTSGGLDA